MPKYQAAVVLAGLVVLTGCGAAKEESAPAPRFKPADLARMVRKQHFGPLARGLKLDREQTGPSNNKQGAKDTLDLEDSARSLRKAGRIRGYDLTYSGSGLSGLGVVQVAESVELFRSEKAASRWLKKQLTDYKRYRGKKHDGVKLAGVEEFDASTGEEAGGLRLRFTFPARGIAIYATVVGFRRGSVVGSTSALLRRNVLVAGDTERIADALDDRIARVGSGKARGGVELSVRQGRLSSTLLVMGFDRAVDPAGLLRLRGKLQARLSGAESARQR
jgi:hypothetical protein